MKVHITGISGSPRKGANTTFLVKECLKAAREIKDVETELIELCDYKYMGGCVACYKCSTIADPNLENLCYSYKDDHNLILKKMIASDGLILGCPVYIAGMTWIFKMFIDRWECLWGRGAGMPLRNKTFGVVTVGGAETGGQEHVVAELLRIGMFADMIPVTPSVVAMLPGAWSSPWGVAGHQGFPAAVLGHAPGYKDAVKQDTAALISARILGKRVAEMAKVIKTGFTIVNPDNGETEYPPGRLSEKFQEEEIHTHYKELGWV